MDVKMFDSKQELNQWLNKDFDYPEYCKVFKLLLIIPTQKHLGKTKTVQIMVPKEEPVVEWSIE